MTTKIILIAAHTPSLAIGANNTIPWKSSEDLQHFKATTLGHAVLMGRKTWESMGSKPLPERQNIVLTRNAEYDAPGATSVSSLAQAIEAAKEQEKLFIIGGGELYSQSLRLAHEAVITVFYDELASEPDTFFPELTRDLGWYLVKTEVHRHEETPSFIVKHYRNVRATSVA